MGEFILGNPMKRLPAFGTHVLIHKIQSFTPYSAVPVGYQAQGYIVGMRDYRRTLSVARYWQRANGNLPPDWSNALFRSSEMLDLWGNRLRTCNSIYEITVADPLPQAPSLAELAKELRIRLPL